MTRRAQLARAGAHLAAIAAVACGDGGPDGEGAAARGGDPPAGEIVFVSERGGAPATYAVPAAGGAARRVGPAPRRRNPSVAPDGSWIAYESDAESFRDLYRLDTSTGEVTRLTEDGDGAFEPAVSPDGARIAFVTTRGGAAEIHVIDPRGGSRRLLLDAPGAEHGPAWSPDGASIAYASDRDGPERVFVAGAEGEAPRRLTRETARDVHEVEPVWSPDGSEIAYERHGADATREVWIVGADSGETWRVSAAGGHAGPPAWSPDGAWLAYADDADEGGGDRRALWIARRDGSARVALTRDGARVWLPQWRLQRERAE